jgi:hypothetical protein
MAEFEELSASDPGWVVALWCFLLLAGISHLFNFKDTHLGVPPPLARPGVSTVDQPESAGSGWLAGWLFAQGHMAGQGWAGARRSRAVQATPKTGFWEGYGVSTVWPKKRPTVFVVGIWQYNTCVPLVHVRTRTMVPDGTRVPWYREAMQALVRVQAHTCMLARIVVEIRAADIAVELEPQL